MTEPLRRVISVGVYSTIYNRPGEGSRMFKLECGHEMRKKTSYPIPKRMRCWECRIGRQP